MAHRDLAAVQVPGPPGTLKGTTAYRRSLEEASDMRCCNSCTEYPVFGALFSGRSQVGARAECRVEHLT